MDREKRICLVANTAWSIFNFRGGLVNRLLKCGYLVTIIAPKDEFSNKLIALGCAFVDIPISAKGVNPVEDFFLTCKLYLLYRKIKPDFIIHYTIKPNIYGSIAARFAGVPSLAVTTGLGYTFSQNNFVAKVARLLYRVAFVSPVEVWFLNDEDKSAFVNQRLIAPSRARLLHGEGVDLSLFAPVQYSTNDGKIRFLLIARMLWDKGIGEFVAAARIVKAIHPNAVFQLLGACGVANPSVIDREQIAMWESEGVIEYLGTTPDVRPIIAQACCVVLPSFYREGIPRTLMEAAAMAKPLITTDNVGCRDVVKNDVSGLVCPVKDVAGLADAFIQMIMMTDSQRHAMGMAGRQFMHDRFDEEIVIKQYISTLETYGLNTENAPKD